MRNLTDPAEVARHVGLLPPLGLVDRLAPRPQALVVSIQRTLADPFVFSDFTESMPSRRSRADGSTRAAGRSEVVEYRDAHPLSRVFPLLYDVLGRAAEDSKSLVTLSDADGRLLWVCGRPAELLRAEGIDFIEGTTTSDDRSMVIDPIGHTDAQVQIHAAEHRTTAARPWSCAAAPIHDPLTHAILGVLDVAGGNEIASAMTMGMVRAAARMAEAELARVSVARSAEQPPGFAAVRIDALGRPDCHVEIDGQALRLSPRHSEIIVILADHPGGLSGDQLAIALYPDEVLTSTLRAELTRLRGVLGILDSRPYRLSAPLQCDWQLVLAHLAAGRVGDALRDYRGPLLPDSDAPGVIERRDRLERGLRTAILASAQAELMVAWTRSRWGAHDLEMWNRQAAILPATSPLRPLAIAEVHRLRAELAVPGAAPMQPPEA
jgi:hypothetical protein